MNTIEKKIAFAGLKMLLKRVKSKSPKLFVTIQWLGGIVASLWALTVAADQAGFFSFLSPHAHVIMVVTVTAIGGLLTGSGLVATLPSTDPNLVSEEVKQAILAQAVQNGTHIAVSAVNNASPKANSVV